MAVEKNVLGATAAFLLMETAIFKKIGQFNCNYLDSLEDIELNLTCIVEGKINYLAGNAVCYHFESQTRMNQGAILQQDYQRLVQFLQNNPMLLNKIPKIR
jgi:GT2 family glycosyltransferase